MGPKQPAEMKPTFTANYRYSQHKPTGNVQQRGRLLLVSAFAGGCKTDWTGRSQSNQTLTKGASSPRAFFASFCVSWRHSLIKLQVTHNSTTSSTAHYIDVYPCVSRTEEGKVRAAPVRPELVALSIQAATGTEAASLEKEE